MNKPGLKIVFIGILIIWIFTGQVFAQQINRFLQNEELLKIKIASVTGHKAQKKCIGEIYQATNETMVSHLKSAKNDQQALLDSLKSYEYCMTCAIADSVLIFYKAIQYNADNLVSSIETKQGINNITTFTYTYNDRKKIKLLEEKYVTVRDTGIIQNAYEYNQQNRVDSIIIQSNGDISKILHFNFTYQYIGWEYYPNDYKITIEYFVDDEGRDTTVTKKEILHNEVNYSSKISYHNNGMIKEKITSYIDKRDEKVKLDSILKYNENGQIVYFALMNNNHLNNYKYIYKYEYEYDSNKILRYYSKKIELKRSKTFVYYYNIKTYNIRDTLSNAYAVHVVSYNSYDTTDIEKKLLMVFYNNKDLLSKNREYIWDDSILVWKLIYNDSIVYNDRNQIKEYYYGGGGTPSSQYEYKECYFYDTEGNKTLYEEYWMNLISGIYSLTFKEFYYYHNGNSTHTHEKVFLENIKVYPNPANDYIIIENKTGSKNYCYQLFTIRGEILNSGYIQNTTYHVDISSHPPAVYYLKLYDKDKNKPAGTFKIVKL